MLLRANDVAVYWVGLPKMKRTGFDAKMAVINAVVRERMTALNVPLIETSALTADAAGDYAAYLPGPSGRPWAAAGGSHRSE